MRTTTTIERTTLDIESFGSDAVRVARAEESARVAASVPYVRSLPTPF